MFPGLIDKLQRRHDLTVEEAAGAMEAIMDGRAQPSQIAGFLVGLAMKGERPDEIVGLARTMRARATPLSRSFAPCSTPAARAATARIRSTSRPSRRYRRGVRRARREARQPQRVEPLRQRRSVRGARREHHRARRRSSSAASRRPASRSSSRRSSIRRCGTRRRRGRSSACARRSTCSVRSRIRPGASRQLVGVPRPELTELVARSLAQLGAERAWVVHGADGLDEISTTGYTKVSECRDGAVNTFYLHPGDVGLSKAAPETLRGGEAADNAAIARAVLAGDAGAPRDIVLLNAGAVAADRRRGASRRHRHGRRRSTAAAPPPSSTPEPPPRRWSSLHRDRRMPRRRLRDDVNRRPRRTTRPRAPICSPRSSPRRGGWSRVRTAAAEDLLRRSASAERRRPFVPRCATAPRRG